MGHYGKAFLLFEKVALSASSGKKPLAKSDFGEIIHIPLLFGEASNHHFSAPMGPYSKSYWCLTKVTFPLREVEKHLEKLPWVKTFTMRQQLVIVNRQTRSNINNPPTYLIAMKQI